MKKTQNVRTFAISPFSFKPLAAIVVLSASSAFAASGSAATTTAAPSGTVPLAQANPAPRVGQPSQAQGQAVCAPDPMKADPGKTGAAQTGKAGTAGNTAAPKGTPNTLKNAPARPTLNQNGSAGMNCLPARPPRHGDFQSGRGQPGQQDFGPRGGNGAGPDGQGQTGNAQTDAARLQDDLSRLTTLLAQTTDAQAKGYLTDARTLLQSGDPSKVRAAHDLIRAAHAITGGQK